MASKYLQQFPVPHGFQEVLADLTRQVLREQPSNIIEFCTLYFEGLERGKKAEGSTRNIPGVSAKNTEEMTKRASNIAKNIEEKKE